ncbi:MAG: C39 family peptidase [Anaerolineae bacterium]|nr:C39 family peptidase [Anaerolineae bacterium]
MQRLAKSFSPLTRFKKLLIMLTPSLNVPFLPQNEFFWCLPASIAMVSAYWQEPLYQADVARWLQTSELETPSSRIQRSTRYGFEVIYQSGSLELLLNR